MQDALIPILFDKDTEAMCLLLELVSAIQICDDYLQFKLIFCLVDYLRRNNTETKKASFNYHNAAQTTQNFPIIS